MHPEQAAFEKAIDESPTDANTHLVYADWLDENGQPDEAAFRRSMGQWMQEHNERGTSPFVREYWSRGSIQPRGSRRFVMPWRVSSTHVPRGINIDDVANWNTMPRTEWQFRTNGTGYFPKDPSHASFDWENAQQGRSMRLWETYRGMEEGLRRAFHNNLKRQRKVQMARRLLARIYSRRGQ